MGAEKFLNHKRSRSETVTLKLRFARDFGCTGATSKYVATAESPNGDMEATRVNNLVDCFVS